MKTSVGKWVDYAQVGVRLGSRGGPSMMRRHGWLITVDVCTVVTALRSKTFCFHCFQPLLMMFQDDMLFKMPLSDQALGCYFVASFVPLKVPMSSMAPQSDLHLHGL